jgi:hypothetical protein
MTIARLERLFNCSIPLDPLIRRQARVSLVVDVETYYYLFDVLGVADLLKTGAQEDFLRDMRLKISSSRIDFDNPLLILLIEDVQIVFDKFNPSYKKISNLFQTQYDGDSIEQLGTESVAPNTILYFNFLDTLSASRENNTIFDKIVSIYLDSEQVCTLLGKNLEKEVVKQRLLIDSLLSRKEDLLVEDTSVEQNRGGGFIIYQRYFQIIKESRWIQLLEERKTEGLDAEKLFELGFFDLYTKTSVVEIEAARHLYSIKKRDRLESAALSVGPTPFTHASSVSITPGELDVSSSMSPVPFSLGERHPLLEMKADLEDRRVDIYVLGDCKKLLISIDPRKISESFFADFIKGFDVNALIVEDFQVSKACDRFFVIQKNYRFTAKEPLDGIITVVRPGQEIKLVEMGFSRLVAQKSRENLAREMADLKLNYDLMPCG